MAIPPSGEQFEIRHGDQRATAVEVGGAIRAYDHGDRHVLNPFATEMMADGAHGTPLIPWPNRLGEGKYTWEGEEYQLPWSEPGTRTAIHGLLRWRNWQCSEREESRVVMAARLHPRKGYPFMLDVSVSYELSDDGLRVTTQATNIGDVPCPYGSGQHPYLSPGEGKVDGGKLQFVAQTRITTDDEQHLPAARVEVPGTKFDFREPRRIGDLQIDCAFTDLERDDAGRASVRLTGTDGVTAEIWIGDDYPYLQIFTGDALDGDRARSGLACEPMTCPPNAFQSGEDLARLEPGASHTATWGARLCS